MKTPIFGVALLAGVACACARKPPAPEPLPPPRLEIAGCTAVQRDGTCEVAPDVTQLNVWLDRPGLTVRAHVADVELAVAAKPVAEGTAARVSLPATRQGASELALDVALDGRTARLGLSLRAVAKDAFIERARALRAEGKIAEARRVLSAEQTVSDTGRARAASLLSRLSLSEGKVDEAIAGLARAAEVHRAAGRVSDEALDGFALAHTRLTQKHDILGAQKALDDLRPALTLWTEGRPHAAYYGALVQLEGGHVAEALDGFERAEAGALRLGLDGLVDVVRDRRIFTLQSVGRGDEAQRALEVMHAERPKDQAPCREAELLNNLGWVQVLRAEASEPWDKVGISSLVEAADIFRKGCPRPIHAQSVLINLALLALADGDRGRAADAVQKARAIHDDPSFEAVSWLLDAEGRLALAEGRADEAMARYTELAARGAAAASAEAQFRATVGRASVLLAQGKLAAAAEAFAAADALLDSEAARVPLGEGRASFLAGRSRAVDGLARTLVALDRVPEALRAVRKARRRALAAAEGADRLARLEGPGRARWDEAIARYRNERDAIDALARDDWKVSADKLPARDQEREVHRDAAKKALEDALALLSDGSSAPAEGSELPPLGDDEALLAVASTSSMGLVFFARGSEVRAAPIPKEALAGDATTLAAALFEPFQGPLSETKRLRILGDDRLGALDIHALPFQGRPLSLTREVEYAVDLPRRPPSGRPQTALIVADPRDDLPGARREAEPVAAAFHGKVLRLEGASATRDALLDAMKQADLMHFAGHGVFGEGTGIASRLLLAGGGELTAGDILVVSRVPTWVMLSGCETAKTESRRVTGLGLATAFLAAGSDVVIAASRPVSDVLGAAMSEAVHRALGAGAEPVDALRQASIDVSTRMPDSDWAAYRAIGR